MVEQKFSDRLSIFVKNKAAFAKKISVTPWMVSKYLNGSMPSGDVLCRISKEVNRSMEWLITGHDSQNTFGCDWDDETKNACKELAAILRLGNCLVRSAILANIATFKITVQQQDEIEKLKEKVRDLELGNPPKGSKSGTGKAPGAGTKKKAM